MKNHSSRKCSRGRTAYRTPSMFLAMASMKNWGFKPGFKKGRLNKSRPNKK